jgi:hypothetical protein
MYDLKFYYNKINERINRQRASVENYGFEFFSVSTIFPRGQLCFEMAREKLLSFKNVTPIVLYALKLFHSAIVTVTILLIR